LSSLHPLNEWSLQLSRGGSDAVTSGSICDATRRSDPTTESGPRYRRGAVAATLVAEARLGTSYHRFQRWSELDRTPRESRERASGLSHGPSTRTRSTTRARELDAPQRGTDVRL
jgi:hypothetical protein